MTEHMSPGQAASAYAHGKHTQPESLILRQCSDYLRAAGFFVVRIQQGLGCHRGIADLVVMKDSRTIWVEIKTPTGRLSDWQEGFRQAVSNAGCEYVVARCVDDVVAL